MKSNEDFNKFFQEYMKFSVKVAFRIVRDKAIAEDIVQEVFWNLYKMGEKLDMSNEKKVRSLVFTSTVNKAKDYLKSAYAKRVQCSIDSDDGKEIEDARYSPEAAILRMEEREYQKLVLEKLRRENRMNYEILIKTKYLGIPPDVVAEEYGITRNNVNNRVLRTRQWIDKELKKLYR